MGSLAALVSRLRRILTPVLAAALALTAAGCGNRHEIVHDAETEGLYLDVGPLDYQVQISRQLNPQVYPDQDFLVGLPEDVDAPEGDEVWFAVFLRVWNHTDEPHPVADEFQIVDTQDNTYEPIEIDYEDNPLVYREVVLPPRDEFPHPDSATYVSPTQGAMLLFKLPVETLGNRPVRLEIASSQDAGEEASVNLDL